VGVQLFAACQVQAIFSYIFLYLQEYLQQTEKNMYMKTMLYYNRVYPQHVALYTNWAVPRPVSSPRPTVSSLSVHVRDAHMERVDRDTTLCDWTHADTSDMQLTKLINFITAEEKFLNVLPVSVSLCNALTCASNGQVSAVGGVSL